VVKKRILKMKFDVTEISGLIKEEVRRYKTQVDVAQVGSVLEVGDGIARVYGLDNAMAGEMLDFEGGVVGEAFNLDEDSVGAVIYGDYTKFRWAMDSWVAWSMHCVNPSTAKALSKAMPAAWLNSRRPVSQTDSLLRSRWQRASKALTPWCRSAAVSVN
jgi:hypothetical protein